MARFLKSPRRIVLNEWVNCYYKDNNELCKITRSCIEIDGVDAGYKVVCYYWGNDIIVGSLKDCIKWMEEHMI